MSSVGVGELLDILDAAEVLWPTSMDEDDRRLSNNHDPVDVVSRQQEEQQQQQQQPEGSQERILASDYDESEKDEKVNDEEDDEEEEDDEDEDEEKGEDSSEELNIARRTRSHVKINDFVVDDNLDFPDVDKNLYQNPDSVSDPEYTNFLYQCYSRAVELGNDTTSEDNDPAYVYNDDIFSHGWKYNLDEGLQLQQQQQQQVARQESDGSVHEFAELRGATTCEPSTSASPNYQPLPMQSAVVADTASALAVQQPTSCVIVDANYDPNHTDLISSFSDQKSAVASLSSAPGFKSPHKTGSARRRLPIFDDDEFKRVLNQQLRQHLQLLGQTYLLASCMTNMQNEAAEAKSHMNSYMKIFRNRRKPSNLLPAIKLVNDFVPPKQLKSSVRLSWRHLPVPETARSIINENPNIFPYRELLPQVAFSLLPEKLVAKKSKIIFTPNEDKLLALALDEFKAEYAQYAYIASLLMAAKTKMQINNHIKNIKRSPGNEDNPIRVYLTSGRLPQVDLDSCSRLRDIASENIYISLDSSSPQGQQEQEQQEQEQIEQEPQCLDQEIKLEPKKEVKLESGQETHLEPEQGPPAKLELKFEPMRGEQDPLEVMHEQEPHEVIHEHEPLQQQHDDMMDMDLDDLIAASTTISKDVGNSHAGTSSVSERNIKNQKLRRSMLSLMSEEFSLSQEMGDQVVQDFLRVAQEKIDAKNYMHLLQLIANVNPPNDGTKSYNEISRFLTKINAPSELLERLVLFLDLDEATRCGCAFNYLHWMRFLKFFHHVEMTHECDAIEKKLKRLIDAIQKDDPHKIKLATANLVNKHPLLKSEYEALSLDGKPHPSLFSNEEDFDDITEPFAINSCSEFEHFEHKLTQDEINYATQSCPCKCHCDSQQHCGKCNLKFMKGRMYLVNKIKPFLAEWSYVEKPQDAGVAPANHEHQNQAPPQQPPPQQPPQQQQLRQQIQQQQTQQQNQNQHQHQQPQINEWTFEEDKEILEFCQAKAEQLDENVSFDTTIFEELVERSGHKKGAKEIADRFNQLMEMYRH